MCLTAPGKADFYVPGTDRPRGTEYADRECPFQLQFAAGETRLRRGWDCDSLRDIASFGDYGRHGVTVSHKKVSFHGKVLMSLF